MCTVCVHTFCNQTLHVQLHRANLDDLADKVIVSAAATASANAEHVAVVGAAIGASIEIADCGFEKITHGCIRRDGYTFCSARTSCFGHDCTVNECVCVCDVMMVVLCAQTTEVWEHFGTILLKNYCKYFHMQDRSFTCNIFLGSK